MTNRRLQKAFGKLDTLKKTRDPEVPGILGFTISGINTVEVGNRSSYVWVRLRSNTNEVIQAFNDQVSPVYGLPVVVVRDETDRNKYRIKGKDLGVYQSWNNTSYLPRHGNQHSFNPSGGGGGDVVFVYNQQFMPLAVHPSGSSGGGNVYVQPYAYYQGAQWKYAGGTGTASLLPYKPTGTSARMVLVYLDNDGNPQLLPGDTYFASNITGNAAVLPYVPALASTTDIPLAAVRLVSGTSTLVWDNLYDLRPIIVSDGFIPTGTSGHEIQDDGTPLAARNALNFVGSNFTVYNTAGATNVSGSFVSAGGGGITERSIPIYDDHIFKVTGTVIDFTDNIAVAVTGSVAFISSSSGGGGIPERSLPIQDDSIFQITGTALSFDSNLSVSVVGSVAHVSATGGTGTASGYYAIKKPTTELSIGRDQNRNTAGPYNVQMCPVYPLIPIWVNTLQWDIRITGTYFLEVYEDNVIIPGTRIATGTVTVTTAATENSITIPETFFNPGHTYYLKLSYVPTGTTVGWSDLNVSDFIYFPWFYFNGLWYGAANAITGSYFNSYNPPIKLQGKFGEYTLIP